MKLRTRSNFQTSKVIETKSVRKLQDEGLLLEK
jgi:hypothetical protein